MRTQSLSLFATIALLTLNQPSSAAPYAIAAQEINLNGYNLLCDSFDSSDPTRSTDGHYDPAKAGGDGAYLASANGIFNSASVANVSIWGFIETKPEFTLAIGPVGSIGSTAWHQAAATGIEPGHHT